MRIDLGDGEGVAVGRVLQPPLIEFFDVRVDDAADLDLSTVAELPVAFRLWVADRAVRSARWPVIGDLPLSSDEEEAEHWFFRQDAFNQDRFRYRSDPGAPLGYVEVPATFEECDGLERAAAWDPEHVEDRLRDHFAGRRNKWVRSLLPQRLLADQFTEFLVDVTGRSPAVTRFGPKSRGFRLATFDDYPGPDQRTTVTMGLSLMDFSIWKRLPLGRELVMCVDAPTKANEPRALLRAVLMEEHRRSLTTDRRAVVEYNGVFAPGYAPHVLFTTTATPTPELIVERKKFGDRYIETMQAIPIDDAELRRYDRSPGQFVRDLEANASLSTYPRLWPD